MDINIGSARNLAGRTKYSASFVADNDIKNKIILDIGCGFGWFELYASQKESRKIIGLELTKKNLEIANRNVKRNNVFFKTGSAVKLPFPQNYFDTVVSWEVIEHIPKNKENKMFSEIRRVLRPKGSFYLSTQNQSFLANTFDPAWWLSGHRHYSTREIKSLARKNGFALQDMRLRGRFWEILAVNNLYLAKWFFGRKLFFENKILKLLNKEYQKSKGFAIIFAKFKKI